MFGYEIVKKDKLKAYQNFYKEYQKCANLIRDFRYEEDKYGSLKGWITVPGILESLLKPLISDYQKLKLENQEDKEQVSLLKHQLSNNSSHAIACREAVIDAHRILDDHIEGRR